MTALAADFRPPIWLKNPHLQTILPRYVVKYTPDYTRHLIKDSLDESQVAFDYLLTDDTKVDGKYQKPLIVLFHGILWSLIFAHVAVWRYRARCFIMQGIRQKFIIT